MLDIEKLQEKDTIIRGVKINGIYRHFKGQFYEVISTAKRTDEGNEDRYMVVYKALYGQEETYVRDLLDFMSEVDRIKYPNAKQKFRFERIKIEKVEKDESYYLGGCKE